MVTAGHIVRKPRGTPIRTLKKLRQKIGRLSLSAGRKRIYIVPMQVCIHGLNEMEILVDCLIQLLLGILFVMQAPRECGTRNWRSRIYPRPNSPKCLRPREERGAPGIVDILSALPYFLKIS